MTSVTALGVRIYLIKKLLEGAEVTSKTRDAPRSAVWTLRACENHLPFWCSITAALVETLAVA